MNWTIGKRITAASGLLCLSLVLVVDQIAPTPEFGASISTDYILGLAKAQGEVQILLDIDRVIMADISGPSLETVAGPGAQS